MNLESAPTPKNPLTERWDVAVVPGKTALMIVDMQYLDAHRDYGMGRNAKELGTAHTLDYYFQQLDEVVIPNIRRLLDTSRHLGLEVIHCRIGSLVCDCRDVSTEHRRHPKDLLAPRDSKEIEILEELRPLDNEIVLTKGASGVFNATAVDQILRNMNIDTLIIVGVATNYCVETAVRDAGDRSYNVILVSDGCAAYSDEAQRFALSILDGSYCRVHSTDTVLGRINDAFETAPYAAVSS